MRPDPTGKIIALVLLSIFLLGLFSLFLRLCATNSCSASGSQQSECQVNCALNVKCCCFKWKVCPDNNSSSSRSRSAVAPVATATGSAGRRDDLLPVPPPAYQELFPQGVPEGRKRNRTNVAKL